MKIQFYISIENCMPILVYALSIDSLFSFSFLIKIATLLQCNIMSNSQQKGREPIASVLNIFS